MNSPAPALELDHVSKRFSVGQGGGLFDGLLRRTKTRRELWALRDVDLRLEAGESIGLIGHNGAGKTTVLKLLAGITRPTRGHVRTHGRVASLINLGAGFHPELTGRENIFLNGVILGLSRREVRERFDAIVEFADLGAFIDTPLKRYSSGMYARLGFAVAAHVEPDVLLVDEVLSVGDVAFQDRSIRKMLSFRDDGRAILFVSHNLSAVEMMCQRVIWLDHGRVRLAGATPDVVRAYLDAVDEGLVDDAAHGAGLVDDAAEPVTLTEVSILDAEQHLQTQFEYGEPLRVRLRCLARQDVQHVQCSVTVRGDYGPLFTATTPTAACWQTGPHELECAFEYLPLLPGLYRVEVQVRHAGTADWALPQTVAAFRVHTDLAAFGSDSLVGATKSRGGFLAVAYDWRVQSSAGEQTLAGLRLPERGRR
ncbi:MAG TPA: ABC transporter ATP-binding protein [Chloroflexota bacterium]|nr:ABC transporter ATP-binding protein [Chloroflexota bacterium]